MLSSNGHGLPVQTVLGATMAAPSKAVTTSFASDAPMEEDDAAQPVRQLDTEFTFSGMATNKKSSSSSHASAALLDDDDDDEEDESFDGHESNDDDVHSDDDDDAEEEVVATGHRSQLKKRATLDKKRRQLQEASRRLGVALDDDDDEDIDLSDTDGECTDGDDDDEDSYDMTERPEDRIGIVRSNVDRLREALGQKRMVTSSASASARLQEAMSKKNYDHLATEDERARARRRDLAIESERTLMETLADAGLAVNARDPLEDGEVDDDPDADQDEPPACALVPALVSQVAADEPSLAESLGEMSRMIMGGVLVGYTKGAPMSTDIGTELQKVWGDSSTACRFYLTWRQTLLHLVERTKSRQCGALFAAYLAATKSSQAYEMELVDYSINPTLLTDNSPPFRCAQCANIVAPRPKPDSMIQTLPAVRFVYHRTNQVAGKSVRVLSAGVQTAPAGGALGKMFVTCERCVPLIRPMNAMLLAPFLVASLAQAFLMERADEDGRVVLDAFTAWEPRTKLCTAIASSYKLLHAVALD